jgi:mycothiol synthase
VHGVGKVSASGRSYRRPVSESLDRPVPTAPPVVQPVVPMDGLPAGLTARALDPADAPSVHAIIEAEELAAVGECGVDLADVVADWRRPGHDLARRGVAVLDGDVVVAYGELADADRIDAGVLPTYQGRGIGTALAAWLRDCARHAGSTVIGMQVPEDSPADRLMRAQGYRLRWTAWDLALPPGADIAARPLPPGHTLADAGPEDEREVWEVLEDAFLEWADRERTPFADFLARVRERPGAAPWNLRVLRGPDHDVVGATHVVLVGEDAYVSRVAVRRDQRGRGLAQALLVDAFALGRAHGATRSTLATDSRTGALGLYRRVGMEVTSTWVNRAVDL